MNVLQSLKSYYKIARADPSRNGITMRKIVLEAVSGAQTRDNNQLTQLAEILGARRQFLSDMSRGRILIEENQVLGLLVDRIGRKSPEGENVISKEW